MLFSMLSVFQFYISTQCQMWLFSVVLYFVLSRYVAHVFSE